MAVQEARPLVAIIRVSATRGRGGDSFISTELQLDGIRAWIEAHPEYTLPDALVFEELDVSGAKPLTKRPSLRRAVELTESGEAAGIIGVRLNRIARSPEVYGEVKRRVLASGGVVVGVDEGGVRTDEPEVDLQDDLTQSFGKYEVARARKVFKLARARAVRRGVATFPAPAGYDRIAKEGDKRGPIGRLVPNEDAVAIGEAFRMRAAGESYNRVAAMLTTSQVRPRPGMKSTFTKGWGRSGAAYLLRNRVYLGELSADEIVNTTAHEPLIDLAMFQAAQRPAKARPGRESSHPFLLTKITRCAGCGAAMVGVMAHPNGRDKAAHALYRCQTRGCQAQASIGARKLETYVEEKLLALLSSIPVSASAEIDDESDIAVLEDRRDQLQREVDAWRSMPVAEIDPSFYARGLSERLAPLDEVLVELGRLRAQQGNMPRGVLTATMPDDWDGMSVAEKREIARGAIEHIVVLKGSAAVPLDQRVRITSL